jgi:hypothetical protein
LASEVADDATWDALGFELGCAASEAEFVAFSLKGTRGFDLGHHLQPLPGILLGIEDFLAGAFFAMTTPEKPQGPDRRPCYFP